jgi:hypothetical protein
MGYTPAIRSRDQEGARPVTYNVKHRTADTAFDILGDQIGEALKEAMPGQIHSVFVSRPEPLVLQLRIREAPDAAPKFISFTVTQSNRPRLTNKSRSCG